MPKALKNGTTFVYSGISRSRASTSALNLSPGSSVLLTTQDIVYPIPPPPLYSMDPLQNGNVTQLTSGASHICAISVLSADLGPSARILLCARHAELAQSCSWD